MNLIVVTPEKVALERTADFVVLPLFDGEIGVAPGRLPMIGRLGFGELRFHKGNQTYRYYVEGGFVEVVADTVTVLTARAILAESLDPAVADEHLARARSRPAHTPELMSHRDRAVAQARAQQRVAKHGWKV